MTSVKPMWRVVCAVVLLTQVGCGTIKTISRIKDARDKADREAMCDTRKFLASSILYSGTYDDLVNRILNPFTCQDDECYSLFTYPFHLVGGLVDLPVSIAADTVMLAYTIPVSLSLKCPQSPPRNAAGPQPP